MLTNRGYYIPMYLYKRKIELIRMKIIKRKYGYLFYTKTVSKILPSQAEKHYCVSVQKKCLKRWILHWYQKRIEWKLMFRAQIHYNLSLQQNMLRRWKYFHIQKKAVKLKDKLAVTHFEKNCRRITLHQYFYKWKLYLQIRKYKIQRKAFAWKFFKSKYNVEDLRPYFKRWCILTAASRKNKSRLNNAQKIYENSLMYKTFMKLSLYSNNQKTKRELRKYVTNLYENKLIQNVLHNWILFTKRKKKKTSDILLAQTHSLFTLKSSCFYRLLENKKRNRFIREKLETFQKQQDYRLKASYFTNIKVFAKHESLKKEKMTWAIQYYDKCLKKKILQHWNDFIQIKRRNILREQELLDATINQLNMCKLRFIFSQWKIFTSYRVELKHKTNMATDFYQRSISSSAFHAWSKFLRYKKSRQMKKRTAENYCREQLVKISFNSWLSFVQEEKQFRKRLQEAKEYYQQNRVNEGILLLLKAGLEVKDTNLRRSMDKSGHQLYLAQKYLGIWKQNALYKNVSNLIGNILDESFFDEDKENMPMTSNFEWYQICFLTPRVPKNFLKD